jgi:hypothetical protein
MQNPSDETEAILNTISKEHAIYAVEMDFVFHHASDWSTSLFAY